MERQDRNEHCVGRRFLLGANDMEGWRGKNYLGGHKAAIALALTKTLDSRQQMRKQKFREVQTFTLDHVGSSRSQITNLGLLTPSLELT